MKINELIPPELPGIAIRTLQGLMTGEDHDYLQEHCNIDVLESWFCDDNSLELDVKLEDGSITTVDLGDIEGLASDLDNYQQIVYYSLLAHAASQLPDWVYESKNFSFDWSTKPNLTLQEFDAAYEKVWDMVFNRGNPGWRETFPDLGGTKMTSLEASILQTMFGYNSHNIQPASNDRLPDWRIAGTFPISRDFIEGLHEIYQSMEPEISLEEIRKVDTSDALTRLHHSLAAVNPEIDAYVSPFTGKPV